MILTITHHYCKPGMTEEAIRRINIGSDYMAGSPGFVYRYEIVGVDNPLKLSSVTVWESREALQASGTKPPDLVFEGESPWDSVESEMFDVHRALPPAGG